MESCADLEEVVVGLVELDLLAGQLKWQLSGACIEDLRTFSGQQCLAQLANHSVTYRKICKL